MRWFDEVRDGNPEFHFSECMDAQAILPRGENETTEALKRRTLAFEDAALKLADEQARSGGQPKLNVAINAFNIAGLKVPDPEKGDEMVAVGHTQKSYRRRDRCKGRRARKARGPQLHERRHRRRCRRRASRSRPPTRCSPSPRPRRLLRRRARWTSPNK